MDAYLVWGSALWSTSDVRLTTDGLLPVKPIDLGATFGSQALWFLVLLALAVVCGGLVWILIRKTVPSVIANSPPLNWRLALLIVTGVALSIASGWTTWDGMTNFTKQPVLAFLITFGIQAILLIVSWLIGESFVNGTGRHLARATSLMETGNPRLLRVLAVLVAILAALLLFFTIFDGRLNSTDSDFLLTDWQSTIYNFLPTALLMSFVAFLILNGGLEVIERNLRSLRTICENSSLWIMFIACLAASVFFSFDSLFSNIFSESERSRVSALRARGQVARLVTDLNETTTDWKHQQQKILMNSQQWDTYTANLDRLIDLAQRAPNAFSKIAAKNLRARQETIGSLKSEFADAQSKQKHLHQTANTARDNIQRLRADIKGQAERIKRFKEQIAQTDREIAGKVSEAEMEAGGFGITRTKGRGPRYREIVRQRRQLELARRGLERELVQAEQHLTSTRGQIALEEQNSTRAASGLAKAHVAMETSEKLITLVSGGSSATNGSSNLDRNPMFLIGELEGARKAFQQQPSPPTLNKLERKCTALVGSLSPIAELKKGAADIDCTSNTLPVAADKAFALTAGLRSLNAKCLGDGKLPQSEETGALLKFARDCIQTSGLTGVDAERFHERVSYIDLNRDDKAHRFVVTLNAFEDGNKLAYLALAIALAIDGLVFMSGLFGSHAARSPLSSIPNPDGRNAQELRAVVDSALLPDALESAVRALGVCRPVESDLSVNYEPGWTHEVDLSRAVLGSRSQILKLLNVATTIGAVRRRDGQSDRYLLRSELIEYLTQFARQAVTVDARREACDELCTLLTIALAPKVADSAAIVQRYLQPMSGSGDFSSFIVSSEVEGSHVEIVRNALNAAASLDYIKCSGKDDPAGLYYAHKHFFYALATLSTDAPKSGALIESIQNTSQKLEKFQHHGSAEPISTSSDLISHNGQDGTEAREEGSRNVPQIEEPAATIRKKPEIREPGRDDLSTQRPPPEHIANTEATKQTAAKASTSSGMILSSDNHDGSNLSAPVPVTNVGSDPPASEPVVVVPTSSVDPGSTYREQLMAGLNLPKEIQNVQSFPEEIRSTARRIWQTLETLAAHHPFLPAILEEVRTSHHDMLARVYSDMCRQAAGDDATQLELLDAAKREIAGSLPVIVIVSRDGVFSRLSSQLSSCDQVADRVAYDVGQQLMRVLPLYLETDWSNADAWKKVEDALQSVVMSDTVRLQRLSVEVGINVSELLALTDGTNDSGRVTDNALPITPREVDEKPQRPGAAKGGNRVS